jgi:hypothetical protein
MAKLMAVPKVAHSVDQKELLMAAHWAEHSVGQLADQTALPKVDH